MTLLGLSTILVYSTIALGNEPLHVVGNAIGEAPLVKGPATLHVDMQECQFDITLRQGEYVKYNGPDVILYQAKGVLPDRELPKLRQSEMPVGYDWWFEQSAKVHHPWMGLMCSGKEDFSWSSRATGDQVSPEVRQIAEANSLKCPADFDGRKWIRKLDKSDSHFVNVDGGVGFVIDDVSGKGIASQRGSRFCIVNGENVLIGISGGGLALPVGSHSAERSVLDILKTLRFRPSTGGAK